MGRRLTTDLSRRRTRATDYASVLGEVSGVIEAARRSVARAINSTMTAAYWLIGRRIVECEQGGKARAEYGGKVIERLASDLTARFGRGFSPANLSQMKKLYLLWPAERILQTPSGESRTPPASRDLRPILQTPSGKSSPGSIDSHLREIAARFPLPWSTYVRLLSVDNENARSFYEAEAVRGSWSVRQLGRQIDSQFYERTALSRNKAAMLARGQRASSTAWPTPEDEIKDPYVLEFLGLKDEYSESAAR